MTRTRGAEAGGAGGEGRDAVSPEEFKRLQAELRDNDAQRPLHEKGVDYGGEHEHKQAGTYQVWHDRRSAMDRVAERGDASKSPFPAGYAHAADVRATGLQEAREMTQYVEAQARDGFIDVLHFDEHPGVTCREREPRNTQRMDVIVDPQGVAHRVGDDGFEEIGRRDVATPEPPQAPLDAARDPEPWRDRSPARGRGIGQ